MSKVAFKRFSVSIDDKTYDAIEAIMKNTGCSQSEVVRDLINKGLATNWVNESADIISSIVRQQMDIAIKPHVERLAKLSSKTGHIAAAACFLNVQSFMDLVPAEKRKIPKEMFDKAKKKAVEYMRTPADEFFANEE